MKYRHLRVAELIKEELSKIIARELEFADALVTVTDVRIGEALENAEVRVGVIPNEALAKVLLELQRKQGYLQHLLTKKLNIKPMPRIEFRADKGDNERIEKLLGAE